MHSDRDQQEKRRPDRVLSMLGIAAKAGKIASGEFSAETAVKSGKAYLVITAGFTVTGRHSAAASERITAPCSQ